MQPLLPRRNVLGFSDGLEAYVSNGYNECSIISAMTFLSTIEELVERLQTVQITKGSVLSRLAPLVCRWAQAVDKLSRDKDAKDGSAELELIRGTSCCFSPCIMPHLTASV